MRLHGCPIDSWQADDGYLKTKEPCRALTTTTPLHLDHLAAQVADRRQLLRMGRLVQGPIPGLDPAAPPNSTKPSGWSATRRC